jgi:hypothetical protein
LPPSRNRSRGTRLIASQCGQTMFSLSTMGAPAKLDVGKLDILDIKA